MKKLVKFGSIIAIIAIIGFVAVSCTDPNGNNTTHTHDWGGWAETTAATCSAKGVETRTCSGCGETQTQENIPMIDHDWEYLPGANEPTCYSEGSGDRKCKHCPEESKGGIYPKTAHTMSDWHTVTAATCIATGERESHCLVEECGYEEDDPALTIIPIDDEYGHDYQYDKNSVAPNCVERGSGTGTCSICTDVINWSASDKDTDPTNHKSLSADFHVPEGKHATCTAAGESYKFCSACEEFDKTDEDSYKAVPALGGHNYPTTTPATCTAASKTFDCNNIVNGEACGHENLEQIVPALGHDHGTSGTGSLICKRVNCNHQYAIGDTGPAGGIIFHVATSGFTVTGYGSSGDNGYFAQYTAYYLEAAPENASASASTMRWSSTNVLIPNLSQNDSDTIDWAIGRGRLNTALIAAAHSADTVANNAAKAAAAYSQGGKDDWFLPSREELNQMYIRRLHVGIITARFWSSSQSDPNFAWYQGFDNGFQYYYLSYSNFNVRAIRAF